MLDAFARAIRQLGDPAMRRVLFFSVGLSLLSFLVIWIAVGYALTHVTFFQTGWLEAAIDVLGGLADRPGKSV